MEVSNAARSARPETVELDGSFALPKGGFAVRREWYLQRDPGVARPTMAPYNFTLGNLYRRRDIYRVIGISGETKGGNWDTGYARHDQDWFIFANIGVPGRTGHDYANAWMGANLLWYGKTHATLHQPAIQSMLVCAGRVYIFVHSDQSAPFVFVGCGTPHAVKSDIVLASQ